MSRTFNEPCGGCGEAHSEKRCLGCMHEMPNQSPPMTGTAKLEARVDTIATTCMDTRGEKGENGVRYDYKMAFIQKALEDGMDALVEALKEIEEKDDLIQSQQALIEEMREALEYIANNSHGSTRNQLREIAHAALKKATP